MSFFDVVNNLTSSNAYIYNPDIDKDVDLFMINRSMSNFPDCIMYANEMNQYPKISKRMLYDYYHFGIQPKKKRFAKWAKPNKDADTMLVSEYFKCNIRVAEQYLALLSPGDLDSIKSKMFKGGRG